MAFTKRLIGPDETLICITSIHWIYVAKGILWLSTFIAAGVLIDYLIARLTLDMYDTGQWHALEALSRYVSRAFIIIGCILFAFYVIKFLSTELALTTKRVIYKRGWVKVVVQESDLEEIKAANVDNGLFGRFLNYGYIMFDSRFVANVTLPAIDDPYRFVKALNQARSDIKDDTIRPVLESAETGPHYPHPDHHLEDAEYKALDSNPARAAKQAIIDDMLDNPALHHPPKNASRHDPAAQPNHPTIFISDVQARKDALRNKILRMFSRKSRQPRENL